MAITKNQPGRCCCGTACGSGGCSIPSALSVTDDFTTTSLSGSGLGPWLGCYFLPVAASPGTLGPCDCFAGNAPGSGSIRIGYIVQFSGAGPNCSITVNRGWPICSTPKNGYCGTYCTDAVSGCTPAAQNCSGNSWTCASLPGGSPGCADSFSGVVSTCAFPLSLTLSLCDLSCGIHTTLPSPFSTGNIVLQ